MSIMTLMLIVIALVFTIAIVKIKPIYYSYPLVLSVNLAIFTAPIWVLYLLIKGRFEDTVSWQYIEPWLPWILTPLCIFVYWIAATSIDKKKEGSWWKGIFATAEPNQAIILSDPLQRLLVSTRGEGANHAQQDYSLRVVLAGKTVPKWLWESVFKTLDLKKEYRLSQKTTEFNLRPGASITATYLIKCQIRRTASACLNFIRNEEEAINRFLQTVAEAFLNDKINNYETFKEAVDASANWNLSDWLRTPAGEEYALQIQVLGITEPELLISDLNQSELVQNLENTSTAVKQMKSILAGSGVSKEDLEEAKKLAELAALLGKNTTAVLTAGGGKGGAGVIVNPGGK